MFITPKQRVFAHYCCKLFNRWVYSGLLYVVTTAIITDLMIMTAHLIKFITASTKQRFFVSYHMIDKTWRGGQDQVQRTTEPQFSSLISRAVRLPPLLPTMKQTVIKSFGGSSGQLPVLLARFKASLAYIPYGAAVCGRTRRLLTLHYYSSCRSQHWWRETKRSWLRSFVAPCCCAGAYFRTWPRLHHGGGGVELI